MPSAALIVLTSFHTSHTLSSLLYAAAPVRALGLRRAREASHGRSRPTIKVSEKRQDVDSHAVIPVSVIWCVMVSMLLALIKGSFAK